MVMHICRYRSCWQRANAEYPSKLCFGAGRLIRCVESDLNSRPTPVLNGVMQANWPGFLHVLNAIKHLQESHHNIACFR